METFRFSLVAGIVVASLACARASEAPAPVVIPALAAPAAPAQSSIDHVAPRRDSVGAQPRSFEWTAVPGADGYAFLLVNEVDQEIWETPVRANTLEVPKDLVLEGGTYYWAVGAFSGGRQVAYSGRAAFVVLK
jgi:hypothetical protein